MKTIWVVAVEKGDEYREYEYPTLKQAKAKMLRAIKHYGEEAVLCYRRTI